MRAMLVNMSHYDNPIKNMLIELGYEVFGTPQEYDNSDTLTAVNKYATAQAEGDILILGDNTIPWTEFGHGRDDWPENTSMPVYAAWTPAQTYKTRATYEVGTIVFATAEELKDLLTKVTDDEVAEALASIAAAHQYLIGPPGSGKEF